MVRLCHRCHAELPAYADPHGASGSSGSDDDRAMFCPRCGAPQVLLPEYMRTESAGEGSAVTTGAVPPPRPRAVEWTMVLRCVAPVALVSSVLTVMAQAATVASFLNTLCVLGGSGIVLALYRVRRPLARIDGRIGLQIGLLTGLAMVAAMGVALAVAGAVARFGMHGMASFDAEITQQFAIFQAQMTEKMQAQDEARAVQQKVLGYFTSPEMRAGLALAYLAILAGFVTMITTLGGGLAGMLQTRRRSLRGGNFRP